jgi:pilus assembly protein CpaB
MDRRFLTVLGVSLVFALVVSSIFYQITARAGGSKAPAKVEPVEMRDVVVAAKPLGVGVTIKPTDVKIEKTPIQAFPKGAFSKVEEVLDRPVISNILAEEPVLDGRLAARGSGLGLAPIIPVGMRAVTVRVNDVSNVAGFVLPGMRVDVLVTGNPPNGGGTVTATCLQNMLVLSAGQQMQADSKGQAIQAPTVTLLATPKQAEVLTLAGNESRVQLVLRNGSDQTTEKTPGAGMAQLFGTRAAPKPERRARVVRTAMAPPAPPPPPPDQVIVIRGDKKTVEVVGSNR